MQTTAPAVVDVAVGVIIRDDGRVLMAERPDDKPSAGFWEFPGGKIEPGESAVAALARELHEELGVQPESALPWITRMHAYPYATVRLHIHRVPRWRGQPHGREGQRLAWVDPHKPAVAPLLPANHSIMQALALPPVYAITQASRYGIPGFLDRLQAALHDGVRLVQVRERGMPADQLRRFASDVTQCARAVGARVLINGDLQLCRAAGADGLHLPSAQLMQMRSRPDTDLCAASCHSREELLRAAQLGVDFAVLSPVLPTDSHPGAATLGWARFAELAGDLPMPVYALGGMQRTMQDVATRHNGHGVALLSAAWKR